jgi:hypothetical protein
MKNILHNNSSYAILFAGVLVLIAAVLTLFIPNNKEEMALES